MARIVFTLAILCSAAALFLAQPLAGRILLPVLGGSPAVWNTCLVFFQAALLAGYCYAHIISQRLSLPAQVIAHAAVLAVAAGFLPVAAHTSPPAGSPIPWLLGTLSLSIGPPFFALSATAPLLQRWFGLSRDRGAHDPYFLYAASNAGSLGGLLAYPLVIEPTLGRSGQSLLFTAGYAVAAVAIVTSGLLAVRFRGGPADDRPAAAATPLSLGRRAWIVVLAAVPSSLMLAVTQHLSSDVAAIPLLWVVPLGIYLVTFMLTFGERPRISAAAWGAMFPAAAAPAVFFLLSGVHHPLPLILAAHLGLLFMAAAMCHKRLYEFRPDATQLTEFYLLTSVGGVLGGAFNALLAPILFSSVVEYPLVIAAAWWLRPQVQSRAILSCVISAAAAAAALLVADAALRGEMVVPAAFGSLASVVDPALRAIPAVTAAVLLARARRPQAAATAAAIISGAMLALPWTGLGGLLLYQGRSFFGVHRVLLHPSGSFTLLRHGSTIHGIQARRREGSDVLDALSREPTTYYARSGPLGDVVEVLRDKKRLNAVAVIGLGAGTIAAYAAAEMTIDFFEIDPLVVRIAADRRLFTYLADAVAERRGRLSGTLGDGRLQLAERPAASSDLVIIDAFASDSIPLHLITREAVAMYAERLRPGGLIAFNISNRYFDLAPPLRAIAVDLGLAAVVRRDIDIPPAEKERAKKESVWVAVGAADAIDALRLRHAGWEPIPARPGARVWTDDYANLLGAFNGW